MASFRPGDRVILAADPEEGWPEERGEVQGKSGKTTWIVQVDEEFRQDGFDDGLREVTADQMSKEA